MSEPDLAVRSPRPLLAGEAVAALALIAWRIGLRPPDTLWRDLVLVAAVVWILDVALRGRSGRPWALAGGATYLFLAYALWHGPYVVAHLRLVL